MNRSRHEFGGSAGVGLSAANEPIAIVGAACRLPGAPDLDSFRQLLLDGVDAVTEIPDDRWNKAQLFHPERGQRGKSYTFAAGVIGDVKSFDAAFFGMSPREAVQTDPQQRLSLELAYEALEDAGLDVGALGGERVGVYVGGSSWDYLTLHVGDPSATDAYSMTGATLCSLANRVSYVFDFRGPSFTVDTACSSSLVALHQACEAIRAGQVPMALVGGLSLLLAPQSFVGFSAASMLSPRGRCHAFDARADGYVRAEGGGFVVLKPLGEAIAAGDPIRAVIRGTGVNSDGRTTGFSLPNKLAQMALLEEVYDRFGLDPEALVYLEAHGTGTPAGDPIEAGALGGVLGQRRSTALPIGSVKTNVGHLEAASGMAGLMKAIVVAEGGLIPASLHLERPNPNIPFEALNLQPVARTQPIAGTGGGLIGINSFGFGGTNAHAVLERPPLASYGQDAEAAPLPPLLLSAQTDASLTALAGAWLDALAATIERDEVELPRLIRSAAINRQQLKRRLVIPAANVEILAEALDAHARGERHALAHTDTAVSGKLAFVFSGNGSQWAGMAQDALTLSPAFREALAEVDAALQPELGWSVTGALEAPDAERLRNTAVAQPLLFAIQVALVTALRAGGVEADAFMGHSVGEVAAAWAAGALDLNQAAHVIAARSRAQQTRHGIGGMAVIGLGAEAAATAIVEAGVDEVTVAAHNGDGGTTIAGSDDGLARMEAAAKERGWRFTRLDLDYAFHSPIMDPIEAELVGSLGMLAPGPSGERFVSTVTGGPIAGGTLDGGYWWRNVREPVLFAEAAKRLVADGYRIFVEIGPHPVVRAYLSEALRSADAEGRVIPTLQRRPAAHDPVQAIAARAHAAGADIRRSAAFLGPISPRGLPRYPWAREPFWLDRTTEAADDFLLPFAHPLLGTPQHGDTDEWRRHIGLELQPWLADHAVGGTPVVPAAALLDMALAAARARFPSATVLELLEVEIGRALVLESGVLRETMLRAGSSGDFEIRSRPRFSEDAWIVHVKGRLASFDDAAPAAKLGTPQRPIGHVSADALYSLAAGMGLDYGPAFHGVTGIDLLGDDEAIAHLASTGRVESGFLLAPDLLDGSLQGLLSLAAGRLGSNGGVVPWRFGRVRLLRHEGAVPAAARMRLTRIGPRSVRADVQLLDADGAAVAELLDCWFVRVALSGQSAAEDMFFHPAIRMVPAEAAAPSIDLAALLPQTDGEPSEAALLADAFAAAAALQALLPLADGDGLLDPAVLARRGQVAEAALPFLHTLLGWLEHDGLAERGDDGAWHLADADLPAPRIILQTLLGDLPAAVAEVASLAAAAEQMPSILRDGPDEALRPSAALVEQSRYHSPSGMAASEALLASVAVIVAAWPRDRTLRILEVGARRGGLTHRLLRTLDAVSFTLTAITESDDLPMLSDALSAIPDARAYTARDEALGGMRFDLIVGLDPGPIALDLASVANDGAPLLLVEPVHGRLQTLLDPAGQASDVTVGQTLAEVRTCTIDAGLWPVRVLAGRISAAAHEPAATSGSITLVAAPGSAHAERLRAALEARGGVVTSQSLADFAGETLPLDAPLALLLDEHGETLAERLALVAGLASRAPEQGRVSVALIVQGAMRGDPASAAIMGTRRVLANEAPTLAARLLRLDAGLPDSHERLAAELLGAGDEEEVALVPGGREVARVHRGLPTSGDAPASLRLAITRPGLLDSLSWNGIEPAAPGAGEIAIEVKAAGLNFRDVMWAMGLLPDEALLDGFAGPTLGLECAGVVTAIGRDVAGFALGDRVMAFAPASLSTHTVTAAHAVMRMPAAMDFAAAATVPVAFLTVAYAVGHLARLSAGETILIHGGAGGVGLAAIQYAKHRGATVFATAGSPAKRALLRSLGVDAVLDSRTLSFADEVMRLTDGEGVDVVLNSLAGEAMQRSLGLVKPFGRFLELGKRDFYENSAIGLRPFRHNVTYFGIDADQLPLKRPALAAELFGEISGMMASGVLRPLPYRVYDYADAEAAFRLMQGSGHIGKIVLAAGAALPRALAGGAELTLDGDGTCVVTGGLGGFGLEAARWLVRCGARRLALVGRRGDRTPGAAETIAAFAADGVDARAYAVDVADAEALATTLETVRADLGPIRGVVHAAVAMDDALLAQLDADRFARALAPKLGGAEALDRLTRADPIDLFLLFSSVTTPMGNPGQGNYVAANAAIEAIAERRHAAGLPALAIQWGPIGDAGYLARETGVSDLLSRQLGSAHLTARQALDMVPTLLASGLPVAGFATVRWAGLRKSLPLLATALFADMELGGASDAGEIDLRALLASCTPEEARDRATAMLIEEVARIMKLAPERIEPQRPLTELGMDSLMAVELRLAVEQRFGVTVPVLALSEGATLATMAGRILRSLGGEEQGPRDDKAQLIERIALHEGGTPQPESAHSFDGPAEGADHPGERGFAAAAAVSP